MKAWTTLLLAGVAATLCGAEPLTRGDRDFALSSFHATRKLFLDSIAGLSEAQWNYKPGPDRWSIAECAEHIVLTEELITGAVHKTVQGKPDVEKRMSPAEARAKDEKLLQVVVDRSQKAQAPEAIQPTKHRFTNAQEVMAAFKKLRDANIDYIDTTNDDLRGFTLPHPLLGKMDAYEFLLLMSAHAERHTLQILEVKASAGYPSK